MYTPTSNVNCIHLSVYNGVDAMHALRHRWPHAPSVGRGIVDIKAGVYTIWRTIRVGGLTTNSIDLPIQVDARTHATATLRERSNAGVGTRGDPRVG